MADVLAELQCGLDSSSTHTVHLEDYTDWVSDEESSLVGKDASGHDSGDDS